MSCDTCPRGQCPECGKCRRGFTDIGFGGNPPAECSYCGCPGCDCPMSVQRTEIKRAEKRPMPIADQLATIAPYLGEAAEQILPDDTDHERIVRLAITRFASIGAAEHGDALFHRDAAELIDEEEAEFADAIVYRARRLSLSPRPLTDDQADAIRMAWRQKYSGEQGARRIANHIAAQIDHEIVHGPRGSGYDVNERAEAPHPTQGDA